MSRHNAAVVVGVGAEAGLGAALCRRLAAEGLWVLVAGRTADKLNKVVSTIKSRGQSATAVVTDATKEDQVVALFDAAERLVDGPLEFVAYNAGNNRMAGLLEMEAAFFEDAWRVACFGGFLVGREAARRMAPRTQGTIAFTGASASLRGRPPFTAFASAKAGLRSLAQAMAREFGPSGIHVAHVVIDGGINGERLRTLAPDFVRSKGETGLLDPEAIANSFWQIHRQDKTAWTHEIDLRPYSETF